MAAVLFGEGIIDVPSEQTGGVLYADIDPLVAYNQISASGLAYFDSLRAMEPALLQGAHTLAYFPYENSVSDSALELRSVVQHARESFLIGLAIRTGTLKQLDDLVEGLNLLTSEYPSRKLLQFGGRVVLEQANFDTDAVVNDGDVASAYSAQRVVSGTGLLSGVFYRIAPL